jgi:AraC-like DNA-binding protein
MTATLHWAGGAWLAAGFGFFRGETGDNAMHAHCAHQLLIAASGEIEAGLAGGSLRAPGVAIPAGVAHRVGAAPALLVYLDALSVEGRAIFPSSGATAQPLDASLCAQLRAAADAPAMRSVLRQAFGLPQPAAPDPRMATVAAALRDAGGEPKREQLAALASLTPSRFSHWFVEQSGLPLRSYRKWLRLELALHQLARGANLTDAAHGAGFADSAHLSRTFREMFGMNPAALLRGVKLDSCFVQAA